MLGPASLPETLMSGCPELLFSLGKWLALPPKDRLRSTWPQAGCRGWSLDQVSALGTGPSFATFLSAVTGIGHMVGSSQMLTGTDVTPQQENLVSRVQCIKWGVLV